MSNIFRVSFLAIKDQKVRENQCAVTKDLWQEINEMKLPEKTRVLCATIVT